MTTRGELDDAIAGALAFPGPALVEIMADPDLVCLLQRRTLGQIGRPSGQIGPSVAAHILATGVIAELASHRRGVSRVVEHRSRQSPTAE